METQDDVQLVKDTVLEIHQDLQSTRNTAHQAAIHQWLSAPDPSTNLNRARRSRQGTTGSWFLAGEIYVRWRVRNSLLWLHGKTGCGKTVLSSTIITDISQSCHFKSGSAVAYFYFDFNDLEKQKSEKMIRSLIVQFSGQSLKNVIELEPLFSSCNNGGRQPEVEGLMKTLNGVLKYFDDAYIVLDALNECSDRYDLLNSIEEIQGWGLSQLHMLLTSRSLSEIEERLEPLTNSYDRICIQSASVDADIASYVHHRLQNDRQLKRWRGKPHVQEEISTTLMEKADGMYVYILAFFQLKLIMSLGSDGLCVN